MNDSLTADARRFRISLAASVLLNLGLLGLIGRLGGLPDLSSPPGQPHLRMVTFSRRLAPPSSGRRGMMTASRLTAAMSLSPPRPQTVPRPRRDPRRLVRPRRPVREAVAPTPIFRIVTAIRPTAPVSYLPAPAVPAQTSFDPPVQAPPRPHTLLPVRLTPLPLSSAAVPAVSIPVPPPVPDARLTKPAPSASSPPAAPTEVARVPAQTEASRGASGGGAGWDAGAGAYTGRKAGGPFGIGDGLAADGVTRHIVYVLDTSGSMKSRLDRAEDELREALHGLRPGETFNIVTFSGGSEMFDPDMAEAAPGNLQRASAFLGGLEASGDTDLEDAVVRALMLRDVNEVVILTDGVPTVGETDPEKLTQALRRFNVRRARISTIGLVGRNPDGTDDSFAAARLLQRIASDSGGASKLVSLGSVNP